MKNPIIILVFEYVRDYGFYLAIAVLFFIYLICKFKFKGFNFFTTFIYAVKNYNLLKICCEINLKNIIYNGSKNTSILSEEIKNAKEIKALFVTANSSFLADHREDLRDCVSKNGSLKLIIGTPNSQFIKDIEEIENLQGTRSINKEIECAIEQLESIKKDAKKINENIHPDNLVKYKNFSTQLRSSIILIDDRICYVIPNTPPITTRENLGFLFWGKNLNEKEGVKHFFKHFDELYERSKKHSVRATNAGNKPS